jgi:hypothetical protein
MGDPNPSIAPSSALSLPTIAAADSQRANGHGKVSQPSFSKPDSSLPSFEHVLVHLSLMLKVLGHSPANGVLSGHIHPRESSNLDMVSVCRVAEQYFRFLIQIVGHVARSRSWTAWVAPCHSWLSHRPVGCFSCIPWHFVGKEQGGASNREDDVGRWPYSCARWVV